MNRSLTVSMLLYCATMSRRLMGTSALSAATPRTLSTPTSTQRQQQLMQDALARIRACNDYPDNLETLDFYVDNIHLGMVRPKVADLLCGVTIENQGPVFEQQQRNRLTLNEKVAGRTYESRSEAVAKVLFQLRQQGLVPGWRDELYPVQQSFYDPPVFSVERAAASFLGAIEYGVHMNGIIQDEATNESFMWMARRAPDKSKYPGMLDHIAAGGQPVGISLYDNVVKECLEEAGIPEAVTKESLRPAGAVSYKKYHADKDVVERCVLFCYDLFLPSDFTPQPVDGEVQEFYKFSKEQVLQTLQLDCNDPIKPNCYVVVIDFLLRHGWLDPDTKGYLDVLRALRSGDCR